MIPSVRSLTLSIAVALTLSSASLCSAQNWRQIGNLPDSLDFRCAYFWDTAHGVVGGANCIYTYNSGVWARATYPEAPDTVKSLRLLDGVHLFAACGSSCVWESVDHGVTWQKTAATITKADDIYLGADGQIHGMNLKGTGGSMTGTTFARRSALSCAAARDDQNNLTYSTDGGLTWQIQSAPYMDAGYTVVADTCNGDFYTLTDGTKGELWKSTNGGKNWLMIYDFAESAKDILEGAPEHVMYIQGINQVYMFMDGITIVNIHGPGSTLEDRRMFEFGTNGKYLIDMVKGAVWLYNGASLSLPNPLVTIALNSSNCEPNYFILTVTMPSYGDSLNIQASTKDGILIAPADTTFAFTPGAAIHRYAIQVPAGQQAGTIYFHDSLWSKQNCSLHLAWDTAFSFNLLPKHEHAWMPASLKILYCQDPRIPVVVMTDVCDTAKVDSVKITSDQGKFIYGGTLPVIVMPGDTDTLWIVGSGLAQGSFTLQVELKGSTLSGNGSFDTILMLDATVGGSGPTSTIAFTSSAKMRSCDSLRFPLSFRTYFCDSLSIDSLTIEDTSGAYTIGVSTPTVIPNSRSDTIWITARQSIPGTYYANLHLYARSALSGKKDTSFPIQYTVIPDPGVPRAVTHNVSRSNCKQATVSFVLQSLPCDSVEFTYSTISISGTGVHMTNDLSLPLDLPSASSDTVHLSFPPQGLSGNYIVTAHLKGKYVGSYVLFDTTVSFTVNFTNEASALASNLSSIDFHSISYCASADTTLTFTNYGCDAITLTGDATQWQAGWSVADPAFPFTLAPDSSFSVRVHFLPSASGFNNTPSPQSIQYTFEYEGGKIGTNLALAMTGIYVPAATSWSISDTAIDFGFMSRCALRTPDTMLTISNTGCDSLSLSAASLAGTGFTLMSGNDTTLAPNESTSYRIHFSDSVPNVYVGSFHLSGLGAHGGNRRDTSVTFRVLIVPGNHAASLNRNAIDFGMTSICEERDTSVTISNTGCEPDTIYAANFSSTQFSFAPDVSFPLILAPDSSVTFPIATNLDTTGHTHANAGTLAFTLSDSVSLASISMAREITYPGTFTLGLTAQPTAPIHAIVPVTVQRTAGTIPASAEEVDFDLVYNEDLLDYADPPEADIRTVNTVVLANGLTDRTFAMKPATDRDTLATFPFQTYLTKNTTTSISLTRPQFLSAGKISPECIASIDSGAVPSNFTLQLACGDSTILAAWNVTAPFTISGIVPNPASTSLRVEGIGDRVWGELDDALGRVVMPVTVYSLPFLLDVRALSEGIYYIRFSASGFIKTWPISIKKN